MTKGQEDLIRYKLSRAEETLWIWVNSTPERLTTELKVIMRTWWR